MELPSWDSFSGALGVSKRPTAQTQVQNRAKYDAPERSPNHFKHNEEPPEHTYYRHNPVDDGSDSGLAAAYQTLQALPSGERPGMFGPGTIARPPDARTASELESDHFTSYRKLGGERKDWVLPNAADEPPSQIKPNTQSWAPTGDYIEEEKFWQERAKQYNTQTFPQTPSELEDATPLEQNIEDTTPRRSKNAQFAPKFSPQKTASNTKGFSNTANFTKSGAAPSPILTTPRKATSSYKRNTNKEDPSDLSFIPFLQAISTTLSEVVAHIQGWGETSQGAVDDSELGNSTLASDQAMALEIGRVKRLQDYISTSLGTGLDIAEKHTPNNQMGSEIRRLREVCRAAICTCLGELIRLGTRERSRWRLFKDQIAKLKQVSASTAREVLKRERAAALRSQQGLVESSKEQTERAYVEWQHKYDQAQEREQQLSDEIAVLRAELNIVSMEQKKTAEDKAHEMEYALYRQRSDYEAALSELKEQQEAKIEEIKTDFENSMESLQKTHEQQINETCASMEGQLSIWKKKAADAEDRALKYEAQNSELDRIRQKDKENQEKALRSLKFEEESKYQNQIAIFKQKYQQEITRLQESFVQKQEALQQQQGEKELELESSLEFQLKKNKQSLEARLKRENEEQIRELKRAHEAEMRRAGRDVIKLKQQLERSKGSSFLQTEADRYKPNSILGTTHKLMEIDKPNGSSLLNNTFGVNQNFSSTSHVAASWLDGYGLDPSGSDLNNPSSSPFRHETSVLRTKPNFSEEGTGSASYAVMDPINLQANLSNSIEDLPRSSPPKPMSRTSQEPRNEMELKAPPTIEKIRADQRRVVGDIRNISSFGEAQWQESLRRLELPQTQSTAVRSSHKSFSKAVQHPEKSASLQLEEYLL